MSNLFYTASGNPVAENRGVSAAIRTEFSSIQGAFEKMPAPVTMLTNNATLGVDSGSANTYVIAANSLIISLTDGMEVVFKAANGATGASTINVNGLGVKAITRPDGTALLPGDIVIGQYVEARYSSTAGLFQLMGGISAPNTAAAANAAANAAVAAIPRATGAANGLLYADDWTTFNNKQAALVAASASVSGFLTSADWTTFNSKPNGEVFSGVASTAVTAAMTTANLGQFYRVTATGATITAPAIASCPTGSVLTVSAEFASGTVVLKGNASELLANPYGATANTFTINAGETIQYVSNGTSWDQLGYATATTTCVTQAASDNSTKLISSLWAKVGFTSSFGASGYVAFPTWLGGFIIQWGAGTCSTTGDVNTLPIAYPSSHYIVLANSLASTGPFVTFTAINFNNFTAYASSGSANIRYFSLGK